MQGKMHGIPVPMKKLGDYLSYEDCLKYENSAIELRDKILIGLLWRCGLRVSEAITIKKINIHLTKPLEHSTITVTGKGNRQGRVPISVDFIPTLQSYIDQFNDDDYIFPTSYTFSKQGHIARQTATNIIRRVGELAGVSTTREGIRVHCHTFRHSLAIFLVNRGVPLPKIQQILRHSSLAPTTYYLQFSAKELSEDYHRAFEDIREDNHADKDI